MSRFEDSELTLLEHLSSVHSETDYLLLEANASVAIALRAQPKRLMIANAAPHALRTPARLVVVETCMSFNDFITLR